MKKPGDERKGSVYWREVSQLITKAGAFGIITLFSQNKNTNEYASIKGKAIHHDEISPPQKDSINITYTGLRYKKPGSKENTKVRARENTRTFLGAVLLVFSI